MSYITPLKGRRSEGGSSYPSGERYEPGMLSAIKSEDDFATFLGVQKKCIEIIEPMNDQPCKTKLCPFVAIKGNNKHCPIHRRTWFPLPGTRGDNMHGPSFFRHANVGGRICDCDQASCRQAGYFPNQSALAIPKQARDVILGTGMLFLEEKLHDFVDNPEKRIYLYPWHFFRRHLTFKNRKWSFKYNDDNIYADEEGKKFTCPPPNNSVRRFVAEELLSTTSPKDRWTTTGMPKWLMVMLAIDDNESDSALSKKVEAEEDMSPKAMQMKVELHRARAHSLKEQLDEKVKNSDAILAAVNERHAKEKLAWKEKHDAALSELKQKHEKELKANEEQLKANEQKYEKQLKANEQTYKEALKAKDADISAATSVIHDQKETIERLNEMIANLDEDVKEKAELLKQLRASGGRPLKFQDLFDGGMLSKNVKNFTFFHTAKQNDLFLEVLNYADGSPGSYPEGDGLCENLADIKVSVGTNDRESKIPRVWIWIQLSTRLS
mmetsp:Transcript_23108/g.46213  ORF Transcript_23108/g.46213 Transcript_23108/m.46213 type:complete len:495 (+) Transcript_23108:221-1705(+)